MDMENIDFNWGKTVVKSIWQGCVRTCACVCACVYDAAGALVIKKLNVQANNLETV